MLRTLVEATSSTGHPVYTREDFTRWLGALVAFVGAVIVSPSAVELAAEKARTRIRSAIATAYEQAATRIPWLRRTTTAGASVGLGWSTLSAVGSVTATGTASLRSDATIEEKVERLLERMDEVDVKLDRLTGALNHRLDEQQRELRELAAQLEGDVARLQAMLEEMKQEAVSIDARALPIVGLGVLLGGIPELWASLPEPLYWLVMLGVIYWTGRAVLLAMRRRAIAAAS